VRRGLAGAVQRGASSEKGAMHMTAGASATAAPSTDGARHTTDPSLPYRPRLLSSGEATSREIFVFYSPRNERVVKVCEYLHLALALQLEFDPSLTAYVERPRKINVSTKHAIDIAFWTRDKAGQERFLIAVPKIGTVGYARDGSALRDRDRMNIAADRHELALTYVLEQELLTASQAIRTYFLLLPHVQSVRRIGSRLVIRQALRAYFTATPRATFRTLVAHFESFSPDHVTAVAASMIHDGTLQLDLSRPLSPDAMLEENHAA
jgi:hypothetical protein